MVALPLGAETLRVATFNTELYRDGPGLLLRDILRGEDAQINAVVAVIANANPDVIALQGFDYDLEGRALSAFALALEDAGAPYPYRFAAPPNAGRMTQLDLDMDGKTGGPRDAQGYGRFFGQGAMALLSRYPIVVEDVQDFSDLLWRDLPGNLYPITDEGPWGGTEAHTIQRLSAHGHWVVPIDHPELGHFHVMTYHATPPVFDGPEDRNGRRNHDETAFWTQYLDDAFGPAPDRAFILLGDANADPNGGDGRPEAISNLLSDPRLLDPLGPEPTVKWDGVGALRVDYILPSSDWHIAATGRSEANPEASRHQLIWVDLTR